MSDKKRKAEATNAIHLHPWSLFAIHFQQAHPSMPVSPAFSPPSQTRALVRDLAGFLTQQMFYWGCDARQRDGNLLVRLGADRVAREQAFGEGSSRYRFPWQSGLIELHSFCVGWYPAAPTDSGVLFIRGRERIFGCAGARPLTPGHYEEEQFRPANAEELLEFCRPLLSWIAAYEERVRDCREESYRDQCFELYRKAGHGRPWLPPELSQVWMEEFLAGPQKTRRAKWLRREWRGLSRGTMAGPVS
jgi:hypothetical protein